MQNMQWIVQNLIKQFSSAVSQRPLKDCRSAGQKPDFTLRLMKLSIHCLSEALVKPHQAQDAYCRSLDSITDW